MRKSSLGFFITLVLSFFPTLVNATPCGNQIDKKKVIFMVDTLGDLPALDAAESAGCDRGEFVVSVPPREVIEFTYKNLNAPQADLLKALDEADGVLQKAQHEFDICDTAICSKERRKDLEGVVKEAKNKYKKLRSDYAEIEPKFLKDYKERFVVDPLDARVKILFDLGEMKKNGQTITASVISGLGGGDDLHGILTTKLYFKTPIRRSELRDALKANPLVSYDIPLLVFSSHDRLTDFETAEWKRVLPKLKTSVEVNQDPANIKDALVKPMSIDGFAAPKKGTPVQNTLAVCDKFLEQMVHGVEMNYFNFFYGKHLGPKDSPHPVLRRHYAFFREYQNCLGATYPQIAVEQSGFMVFFEDVKKNFATVFEKEIAESERAISALTEDVWGVKLSSEVKKLKAEYTSLKFDKIAPVTRDQILHNLALMSSAKSPEIVRMKGLIQRYLFELSPRCMDLDDWIQFVPGHKPQGRCKP